MGHNVGDRTDTHGCTLNQGCGGGIGFYDGTTTINGRSIKAHASEWVKLTKTGLRIPWDI